MKKKNDDRKITNRLWELFDAEPEELVLTEEEQQFLEERKELEQNDDIRDLIGYSKHYEQLRKYGLDEIVMKDLVFEIKWYLENRREDFVKMEFYKKFKDHRVVKKTMNEYSKN